MMQVEAVAQRIAAANVQFYEARPDAELEPMVFMLDAEGAITETRIIPMANRLEKTIAVTFMALLIERTQAAGVAFASEAWSTTRNRPWQASDPMPSEDPDRREVIVTAVKSRQGESFLITQAIHRDEAGHVLRLEIEPPADDMRIPMLDRLLPTEKPTLQ